MQDNEQIFIQLWSVSDDFLGMIVPMPTGITWSNQTGGVSCSHPSIEGLFVPLENYRTPSRAQDPFYDRWGQKPEDALPLIRRLLEASKYLQEIFESPTLEELQQMRELTLGAQEAWIPLKVKTGPRGIRSPIPPHVQPFMGRVVILTYPNSD